MYHFFIEKTDISGDLVTLTGENYNHAANVLRLRPGEQLMVSDEDGTDYYCTVAAAAAAGKGTAGSTEEEKKL